MSPTLVVSVQIYSTARSSSNRPLLKNAIIEDSKREGSEERIVLAFKFKDDRDI